MSDQNNSADQEIKRKIYQAQLDYYRQRLQPREAALPSMKERLADAQEELERTNLEIAELNASIDALLDLADREGVSLDQM